MKISMLVAMGENRAIGHEGELPWRLHEDLKRFRMLTMGHHIIMGRKTFESIGRSLTGRQMIVLTRDPNFSALGETVAHSLDEALAIAQKRGDHEAFIIGGAQVYADALDQIDTIYLTLVHAEPEADTFLPAYDEAAWQEVSSERHAADERNQYAFTFKTLERVS
ncbi:MAG: dihydrofolate reductase [Anaerolineales bacterium]|nr:dihydrofolate reductase [Anaerolineales bacterium]